MASDDIFTSCPTQAACPIRVRPQLRARALQMRISPAQWLRDAAVTRRLPSPPVVPVDREQYADLARLSANLNQLTRLANEGERVTIADGLLRRLLDETKRLRLGLLGVRGSDDEC